MPRGPWILLPVVCALATGCGGGGALSQKAFQKQSESIQSLAAESSLVAQGAAEDRTTDAFVRVHTDYLKEAAKKIETDLGSAHASGQLEEKRKRAERLAARVVDDLGRLHRAPGDRRLAGRLKSSLADDAKAAEKLAK